MMRRHSLYNYAFINPVFFIDPDGMMPLAGMQTGAVEHTGGFEVANKDGSNAQHFSNVNDAFAAASEINSSLNAQNYSNYFASVAESAAEGDVGFGGGCPEGMDCGGGMQRGNTPIPIGDHSGSVRKDYSTSTSTGGSFWELSGDFAFMGGFGFSVGKVFDASGNSKFFFNFKGNIGYGAGLSMNTGIITPTGNHSFVVDDIGGRSGSYNGGVTGGFIDANFQVGGSVDRNWHAKDKMNVYKFWDTERGYKTTQMGIGPGLGYLFGSMFSYGTTKTF